MNPRLPKATHNPDDPMSICTNFNNQNQNRSKNPTDSIFDFSNNDSFPSFGTVDDDPSFRLVDGKPPQRVLDAFGSLRQKLVILFHIQNYN